MKYARKVLILGESRSNPKMALPKKLKSLSVLPLLTCAVADGNIVVSKYEFNPEVHVNLVDSLKK